MPEWLFFTAVISLVVGVAAHVKGLLSGREEAKLNQKVLMDGLKEALRYSEGRILSLELSLKETMDMNSRLSRKLDEQYSLEHLRNKAKHLRGCK